MDKITDLYHEAIKFNHESLILAIDYLVNERKVLQMNDSADKLTYFLQDRFRVKLNEYLIKYKEERNEPTK